MTNQARKLLGRGLIMALVGALSLGALWRAGVLAEGGEGTAPEAAVSGASAEQERRDTREERHQAWLERQVQRALNMLPYYTEFDFLSFRVEGDRVILMGAVRRPTLRSDAQAAIRGIEGVEEVVNQVEVLPLSPHDDRLRRALYQAIYSRLPRYAAPPVGAIHILVRNGHVTLEGAVASEADRNLANIQAHTVSGTFTVTNNLRVDSRSG